MDLFAADDSRPVHFMGIGGAGMSALALLARRRGVEVTGCDNDPTGAADLIELGRAREQRDETDEQLFVARAGSEDLQLRQQSFVGAAPAQVAAFEELDAGVRGRRLRAHAWEGRAVDAVEELLARAGRSHAPVCRPRF